MESETLFRLEELLSRITGKSMWGILVGPAGVHIHFGHEHSPSGSERCGEYSLWIKGIIRLNDKARRQLSTPPSLQALEAQLTGILTNRLPTSTGVDHKNNVLRLVVSDEILLSAFPSNKEQGHPWILYDHTASPTAYAVVYKDTIDFRTEGTVRE